MRKSYLIEKEFQTKFILKFCALVAAGGLLFIGILYLLLMQSTTVSIVDSRVAVRTTADFILPILVQTVVIVTVIVSLATIAVTLFISHKIAGPLYRFKKVLQELESGDFTSDFRLRHMDQLQELAGVFNSMVKKIREELKQLKDNSVSLKDKLEKLSEHEISELKRPILTELKKISEELNRVVRYFKT
ncbi:MAG: methyl-accepting chemotaxis protein [Candidatus Omnitrophica bacterium]|nr:methyl-accepting chemotaxis protein [Candidatus Omnitrophota bacterium]